MNNLCEYRVEGQNDMTNNLDELAEIYENERIVRIVSDALYSVEHHFSDITKIERRIYNNIIRTSRNKAINKLANGFVRRLVMKEVTSMINGERYSVGELTRFCELDGEDEEGSEMNYEPVDDNNSTGEDNLSFYELIKRIVPTGDERRRIIVEEWSYGNTNDRDIARLLEEQLGGKLKTHVTFITRYRNECKEILGGVEGG